MNDLIIGIETTLLGMVVVFATLILLYGLLALFKVLFYKESKQSPAKSVLPTEPIVEQVEDQSSDEELVAVITAAIAASLGRSADSLVVRSIYRVPQSTPAWGRVGVETQMGQRL